MTENPTTERVRDRYVEFTYEPELGTYHFRVPDLRITGGGQQTLDEALQAAAEAIDFALEPAADV